MNEKIEVQCHSKFTLSLVLLLGKWTKAVILFSFDRLRNVNFHQIQPSNISLAGEKEKKPTKRYDTKRFKRFENTHIHRVRARACTCSHFKPYKSIWHEIRKIDERERGIEKALRYKYIWLTHSPSDDDDNGKKINKY